MFTDQNLGEVRKVLFSNIYNNKYDNKKTYNEIVIEIQKLYTNLNNSNTLDLKQLIDEAVFESKGGWNCTFATLYAYKTVSLALGSTKNLEFVKENSIFVYDPTISGKKKTELIFENCCGNLGKRTLFYHKDMNNNYTIYQKDNDSVGIYKFAFEKELRKRICDEIGNLQLSLTDNSYASFKYINDNKIIFS
eukprot:gene12903-7415_t